MKPRVTVVTAGHIATCPRMLKTADALHQAGYHVRVVSASHTAWAAAADRTIRLTRQWEWTVIDYARSSARSRQLGTGARMRAAQFASRVAGIQRTPLPLAQRAYGRIHDELVHAIITEPADLVYGGTSGALAAVAEGGRRLGVPYALDLEDFHSDEQSGPGSDDAHALAARIEQHVLSGAAFLTAGSPMIADAYAAKYRVRPRPIHNTFSIRFQSSGGPDVSQSIRLYWFSQTIGAGRGLDDVVRAVGRAGVRAELHVRGRPVPEYLTELRRLQHDVAPSLTLVHHEPAFPDDMVEVAHGYDLGLSCEPPTTSNHRFCLSNKTFTYLAAGMPAVLSRTPAQERLAADLGDAAFVYDPGDVATLADHFRRWIGDPAVRRSAREAARSAALRRWHWEHADDRGALLGAVNAVTPVTA